MSSTPTLSERLTQIIEPLRLAVAAHGGLHRADVPLVVLLWSYLHRVAKRFESLTRRLAENGAATPPKPRADRPAKPPKPRLPQRFGYLARFGWQFRNYGSQLRHLLDDPEMRDLLATSPQAARILRPLCRMLGIEAHPDLPPTLYLPRKPRPPVTRAAAPPAPSAPPATLAPQPWHWPKPA